MSVKSWSIGAVMAASLHVAAWAQGETQFVSQPVRAAEVKASTAQDAKAYRQDGARHLYAAYPHRVYRGKLPPLLHAVVVVETVLDAQGQPVAINMIREPSHAPEVTAAVREMIRRAAPLPTPARMAGGVSYMEVWLVDKSGRFQLDTLSEGQLRE